MLFEAQLRVTRLQTLLFGKRRRRRIRAASGPPETPEGVADTRGEAVVGEVCGDAMTRRGDAQSASGMGALENEGKPSRSGGHRPVSGRLGAGAYASAEYVGCHPGALGVGQRCPGCGQGRLYVL